MLDGNTPNLPIMHYIFHLCSFYQENTSDSRDNPGYSTLNRIYHKIRVTIILIVSITKFSIVWLVLRMPICHVIGARSRGCLITGIQFKLFVIRYPRDSLVNYTFLCIMAIFSQCFFQFSKLQAFSFKRSSHKTFLILKCVIATIN